MVSPRSYFARMNENRGDKSWLSEAQLLTGTEEFFKSNDYSKIERDKILNQGAKTFSSPIVAAKTTNNEGKETSDIIVTMFKSRSNNMI